MEYKQAGWLPHLLETVPIEARKNQTSMYTIALEGWRRGLSLKFYNLNQDNKLQIRYSLSYKDKTHYFNGSYGDMISEEAVEICEDKSMTSIHLLNAGVPIPKGKRFGAEETDEEIVQYGKKIKFPLVVKPTNGRAGRGVVANIKNEFELKDALFHIRQELMFDEILVQQYVAGEEVRVFVLGDRVLGAANRRPANVIGDGVSTIKTLINEKNEFRKYIPHLYFRPIKIDKEVKNSIQSAGYSIDSIPEKGERLMLRKISNVSQGGDPVDVTQKLSTEQKTIAINATKAIPGLAHCGVDMILNNDNNSAKVLELNTKPGIGSHLFPIEGTAIDIPKELVDFYFPETKGIKTNESNVYFDFRSIQDPLNGRSTIEIEVAPTVSKRLIAKKYIIHGDIELMGFYRWLQRRVFAQNLNGFIKRIDDKHIEIVIAGTQIKDVDNFKDVLKERNKKIDVVSEENWEKPIKIGFELIDGYNTLSARELEVELKQMEKDIKSTQKEQHRLEHRIRLMRQSRTWKLTVPIRNLMNVIRRVKLGIQKG
ncbi:acylphosphatase [Virgibacillus sp. CBA3643]|uniref:acylphosphatase n=1 Tax=Virgibacillus sp. CBA3643 TaxID=2942278 RepID=UPI0035A3945B